MDTRVKLPGGQSFVLIFRVSYDEKEMKPIQEDGRLIYDTKGLDMNKFKLYLVPIGTEDLPESLVNSIMEDYKKECMKKVVFRE
jgi:hypothetical protein